MKVESCRIECGMAQTLMSLPSGVAARREKGSRLEDGTICEAEIHWYEAHGIGKKELKFKKPLRNR